MGLYGLIGFLIIKNTQTVPKIEMAEPLKPYSLNKFTVI